MSNITKAELQERYKAAKLRIKELETENESLKVENESLKVEIEKLQPTNPVQKMLEEAYKLGLEDGKRGI